MPRVVIYMDPTEADLGPLRFDDSGRVVGDIAVRPSDALAPIIVHGVGIPFEEIPIDIRNALDRLRGLLVSRAVQDLQMTKPTKAVSWEVRGEDGT